MWSVHQTAMDEVPGSRLSWNDLGTVAAGGGVQEQGRQVGSLAFMGAVIAKWRHRYQIFWRIRHRF